MKKMMMASIASAAVLALGACAENNNPVENIREAASDTALQGKEFVGACSDKPVDAVLSGIITGGDASVKSMTTSYEFDGANVFRKTVFFGQLNCQGEPAGQFMEEGSFEIIDGAQKTADNATQIDMKFTKLSVKIESDAGVEVAKAMNLCGINSWTKGQESEVTVKSSEATCYGTQVPRDVANVYKVEENRLYLGTSDKDAVDPSARPASLDTGVVYTAQ